MARTRHAYRLEELNWPQAQAAFEVGAMAVLPVGSLEQHGRHLAISTDNVLGDALAAAELEKLREAKRTGGMSHGCELATSLMRYLRPELVDMDKAVHDISQPDSRFYWRDILRGSRGVALADLTRHASRTGLVGDPTVATAEKGRQFFDLIVSATVAFLVEFSLRDVEVTLDFPLKHQRTEIE